MKKPPPQHYLVVKKKLNDLVISRARGYNRRDMKEIDRNAIILEEINGKFDYLVERFDITDSKIASLEKRMDKVEENTRDIPVMISTIKDHSRQIQEHERRIDFVEKQVA